MDEGRFSKFREQNWVGDSLYLPNDKTTDTQQLAFREYEVPDPIRILKVEQFLAKHFKNSLADLRVLEIGITKGGLADRLKNSGARCFGVDIHPREIKGIRIVKYDLNYGFPKFDKEFDVIFAGEVIEHIFDDVTFIKNCKDQLKIDGLLILTTPNLVFLVNRLRILFGKMPLFSYAPYHYHIYNIKVLRTLLEQNGFKIVKIVASHILFSTRRHRVGRIFEILADLWPSLGAHIIIISTKY